MSVKIVRPHRESVTTIGKDGRRIRLHPADVRGRFANARRAVAGLMIGVFLALPWIPINGHPAVFLDIETRRFHLFGATLTLSDIWLLFFVITGLGFSIYAVTSIFGRIWCGWTCPQTVFLDHVFRRIERLIEGDAPARRRLDELPARAPERLLKRGGKALAYFVMCWLIAHGCMAYFVSIAGVKAMIVDGPGEHPAAFTAMTLITGALFFNFWWFREQLCLIICPYGRLQSALIDDDSIVIGYDATRGEPRGAPKTPGVGACVDCNRCVQVCPTGIDIRQGLQLECIGCTACVDACDAVMDKLGRPRGLVRFASLRELSGGKTRLLRFRTIAYGVLLLIGAVVATLAVSRVRDASFKLIRPPGSALFLASDTRVLNVFTLKLVNKTEVAHTYQLLLRDAPAYLTAPALADGVRVAPQQEIALPVTFVVPRDKITGDIPFTIELRDETGRVIATQKARFNGPSR